MGGRPVVVIPNSGRRSKEEQLLEEELKLVKRLNNQAASGSTKIDMNVKYEFLAPTTTPSSSESNSIYFDQVLLRRLQEATSSGSPVLLNTRTESSLPLNTRTESSLLSEFQLNGRGGNSPFRFTTTTSPASPAPASPTPSSPTSTAS